MPTVHVQWFKGRSQETREKVAKAFIEALASIEGTHVKGPEDVEIWFFDIEPAASSVKVKRSGRAGSISRTRRRRRSTPQTRRSEAPIRIG